MPKFTEKQLAFIHHKALGYTNAKAMIAAGYSSNGASQAGSQLAQRPEFKAAIKKARSALPKEAKNAIAMQETPGVRLSVKMQREKYADPEQFLRDLMNNPAVPLLMRKDAAKDLMPYVHARIGEKGKKQSAKETAHGIAHKGSKSKFKTQKAPNVVDFHRRAANG